MKKTFKHFFCLFVAILCLGQMWGTVYVIDLPSPTKVDDNYVYTYSTSSEIKVKNNEVWIEIPASDLSGTVKIKGSGTNNSRYLYIYKTNGTVKDETRKIDYKTTYQDFSFTASDIKTDDTKYYLVFGTSDDYKINGECAKLTVAAPDCTAPEIEWNIEPAGGSKGSNATASVTTTPASQTITWNSSNTSVATVEGGTISFIAPGTTKISAEFTYSGSDYCKQKVSVSKDITVPIDAITPGTNDKVWYYTTAIPSSKPDNGLNFDATKSANGLYGVKLNSTGYAWFVKPAVAGKLRIGAHSGSGTSAYEVYVYACDNEGTKSGEALGSLSITSAGGVSSQMDISADIAGIRIERKTSAEGVLYFIEFEANEAICTTPSNDATFAATNSNIEIAYGENNASTALTFTKGDNTSNPTFVVTKGSSATSDATVSNGTFTATAVGTYVVTATQAEDGTYCEVLKQVTITVTEEEVPVVDDCPESGIVYSAVTTATGNISISTTEGLELNTSTHKTTTTGGKMYVISKQSDSKNLITNGSFCHTNNDTYFKLELACALEAGDVISVSVGKDGSNDRGVWVSTATSRPSSAPACALTAKNSSLVPKTYIVTTTDEYVGKDVFYIYRATGNTTYFNNISITRPEKFSVTYYKNDGTDASTVATDVAVVAANEFTRSGYRFIEWNTQADGKGTEVNVGASVTADIELYAIWAQEYSVSYANTGAASGDAPTNTNKYITDEKFKVAGAGSMVAADNYVFSGWNDGTATYAENDDYTVGSANVSFAPVWVLSYAVTYKANGGTLPNGAEASDIVANNPSTIAQCQFLPADGKVFLKWNTQADGKGVDYLPGASISTTIELYAQYQTVSCDNRQTLTKAVLTSASEATVTGYNNDEFAGAAKLASLGGSSGTSTYDFGEGEVTGYKLASGGNSHFLATLSKGSFQAGDQVKIAITTSSANSRLDICAGSDKANMLEVIRLENITAPGIYAYTLTSADATAINTAGYKSIGIFRASGENTNAYIYSVEITGCRNWSIYHALTFKNVDGTATIATENLAEGDLAGTVAPSAPVIDDKYFAGWSESIDGTPVDMSVYTITEDKILYAVYEDCPTYGTIFKFAVATGKTNGNIFSQTPNSMELTTENYLSELENGTVTAAVTGSSNDRIRYNDGKGLEFNGDNKGSLTISMDCPMKTGDVVRIINYAASSNRLKLSANSKDVQVDGNGTETIQTIEVPAEWNDQRTLVLSRDNKNPKFTYVEIYRRPVLTSVSLEDLNLKVGATGTPVMTLNPEGALVTSEVWAITASTATGTTINAETGLITAGQTAGQLTVQVTVNTDKVATCTVKVVPGFEAPKPVTETTTWNWATLAVAAGDGPQIANSDTVLANYLSGDEWETLSGNPGGRPYRKNPDYMCYQGTSLSFRTTKPGILTLKAGYTSDDKVCDVSVNGHVIGSTPATPANLNSIVVPAGDVYISATSMRIYSMTFDTDLSAHTLEVNVLGGYNRAVTAGNYGTICLPNGGVMAGASIFEIAYFDNAQRKIFFDEVVDGHMVAGRPHIFLPNEGETELKVYYTDNANATAGDYRGLYGFFDTSDDNAIKKLEENDYFLYNNQYYVVDHAAVGLVAVGNYRAYIKLSDIDGYPTTPAPGRRRVAMSVNGEQVATGVENVTDANAPRKVLIDGRMFIMLGEKMYDVTGQIAK